MGTVSAGIDAADPDGGDVFDGWLFAYCETDKGWHDSV